MSDRTYYEKKLDELRKGGFFTVKNDIFAYEMDPYERCVYFYLLCLSAQSGCCYPAIKTIARCCGCSPNKARQAVQSLADRRFISVTRSYQIGAHGNREANNWYYILDLPPRPKKEEPPKSKYILADGTDEQPDNRISTVYRSVLGEDADEPVSV